jgi:hypothetical protein
MDTLDGSHGTAFTYLPIVYQDDCQVVLGEFHHVQSDELRYEVVLRFLGAEGREVEKPLPNKPLQRTENLPRKSRHFSLTLEGVSWVDRSDRGRFIAIARSSN